MPLIVNNDIDIFTSNIRRFIRSDKEEYTIKQIEEAIRKLGHFIKKYEKVTYDTYNNYLKLALDEKNKRYINPDDEKLKGAIEDYVITTNNDNEKNTLENDYVENWEHLDDYKKINKNISSNDNSSSTVSLNEFFNDSEDKNNTKILNKTKYQNDDYRDMEKFIEDDKNADNPDEDDNIVDIDDEDDNIVDIDDEESPLSDLKYKIPLTILAILLVIILLITQLMVIAFWIWIICMVVTLPFAIINEKKIGKFKFSRFAQNTAIGPVFIYKYMKK